MATSLPSRKRWMWPWSPWTRVGVWLTTLAPSRFRTSWGGACFTVWPWGGSSRVSWAGLLGRSAATAAVLVGPAEPPVPSSPQEQAGTAMAATTTPRAAGRRRWVRVWCGSMVVPLFDELFEPAAALGAAGGGGRHQGP